MWDTLLHLAPEPDRPAQCPVAWYRIADGHLGIASADDGVASRFRELYRECAVAAPPADASARVICTVVPGPADRTVTVDFEDPEPLDQAAFLCHLFADRGYRETDGPAGWRLVATPESPGGLVACRGDRVVADRAGLWQPLVANLALNRMLRLQRDVLFFHASAIALAGRGVMFLGPKGAGKTTLSVAAAARGHGFFGDEITAVRMPSLALVPVLRSASVRTGPMPAALRAVLDRASSPVEAYPDGSTRHRTYVSELCPSSVPSAMPLHYVVFLRGQAAAARLEPLESSATLLSDLSPLGCTTWGADRAPRAMQLMGLISRTQCYALWLGDPDETLGLLERTLEVG